jgi:hypothetical protein
MKLFKVPAGAQGYLLVDGPVMPELRPWTVRKDMIFDRNDLVADPITLANGDFIGPKTIGHDLVTKGYSLFTEPGVDGSHKYTLAVPFSAVEVL